MATEIILPKLGMNMDIATIIAWHKQVGDSVRAGDVLADVETDKATIELEAEATGIIRKLLIDEGAQASVNQPIAIIGDADEDISAIEQRLMSAPVEQASHVDRVYETWKGQSGAPAGLQPQTASPLMTNNGNGRSNGAGTGKLDPDAIRDRLAQKGVLAAPPAATAQTRLAIYGSGLGARQLLEITRLLSDIEVVGLIDDDPRTHGSSLGGAQVLGGFDELRNLVERKQVDGVVLSFHSEVRKRVHERINQELDIQIHPLVDPRAIVGMDVTIGPGALIEAGAVIGPGVTIGEGAIVDVGVVVAHDCSIGPFSHLSPGCRLSGVVCLTENVLVGVGAALNSTITIGKNVIITPGAAVMNDLPDDVIAGGVPAKVMGKSRRGC